MNQNNVPMDDCGQDAVFWSSVEALLNENGGLNLRAYRRRVRDLLVMVCDFEQKASVGNYGSLFFQIDALCKRHGIKGRDKFKIQRVRRHTGKNGVNDVKVIKSDIRVISDFYCSIYGGEIPSDIEKQLPEKECVEDEVQAKSVKMPPVVRCIVLAVEGDFFTVELDSVDNDQYRINYQTTEWSYLKKIVRSGVQLNLINPVVKDQEIQPRFIVVEPDFLLDVSSIAACFTEYGHHPLSFIVNKMRRKPLTQPILLGNFAGSALDDIIHTPEEEEYSVNNSIRNNFKEKALDFCSCPQFDADLFVKNAKDQASNLVQSVDTLFSEYDKNLAILEPTFVCEALGIQGRVDLMTIDFSLLVEQKSGKNGFIEWNKGEHGGRMMSDAHFVQLLLYLGVMIYNFQRNPNKVDVKLLYSRYVPQLGLVNVGFERKTFAEALKLRNQIVATEYAIANQGFDKIINYITPATLNEKKITSDFYARYLLPQLMEVTSPLQSLNELERKYFCSMASFSYREQMLGKVGRKEGATGCTADLWRLPLDKKIESGNIFVGLKIIEKTVSSSFNGYDTITLSVPELGEDFLPNFRVGDMVFLYSYEVGKEPDVCNSLLYSGYLSKLTNDVIEVRLGDGQKNPDLIDHYSPIFALEHAGTDASSNAEMRGLLEFVTAPLERKQLLLAQREPTADLSQTLSQQYDTALSDTLLKVKQAQDYFLLIGPPGTGKTHRAIRFIVQEELLKEEANILLLSYTNRAVDELCSMLTEDLGIDFIRLGRSYSCDNRYKEYLLNAALDSENPKLGDMKSKIRSSRVFVSTVSYLLSRPNIFLLKHFSLAVIDEASQILEPDLIGILASHMKRNDFCDIDKFVMVGDYKQLPAVVLQSKKESQINDETLNKAGFTDCRMSLFQRLIYQEQAKHRTQFVGILRKQGRMHPEIAAFPNKMFYAYEQLELVPCEHQTEIDLHYDANLAEDALAEKLREHRLLFFSSPYCFSTSLSDKVNTYEAQLAAQIAVRIANFYGTEFDPRSTLGIIVPYRNQIALIRKELEKAFKEYQDLSRTDTITIDTVERFQGSQREVIIFSATVQQLYQLEFLTSNNFVEDFDKGGRIIDPKLNVVMTRARKQLILIGNEQVLSNDSVYKSLIEHVKMSGLYVDNNNIEMS